MYQDDVLLRDVCFITWCIIVMYNVSSRGTLCSCTLHYRRKQNQTGLAGTTDLSFGSTGPKYFVSSSSPNHNDSVWVLPVISLHLTYTVSPVRACLIIWRERFRGSQKEDDRGPLSIQSSLLWMIHEYICVSISLDGSYIYTIHTVLSIVPQIAASFSLCLSPNAETMD